MYDFVRWHQSQVKSSETINFLDGQHLTNFTLDRIGKTIDSTGELVIGFDVVNPSATRFIGIGPTRWSTSAAV